MFLCKKGKSFLRKYAVATLVAWNPTGLAASTSQAQLVIPTTGWITDYVAVAAPKI